MQEPPNSLEWPMKRFVVINDQVNHLSVFYLNTEIYVVEIPPVRHSRTEPPYAGKMRVVIAVISRWESDGFDHLIQCHAMRHPLQSRTHILRSINVDSPSEDGGE